MLENGAVAPLLEGLKHKKYEVRSACVYALGGFLFVRVLFCVCTFPPLLVASSNVFQGMARAGNMGEHEDSRLRIISEGACPGLVKFLNEGHRENSLEEELMALESIYKLSQHLKNHNRMVCHASFEPFSWDIFEFILCTQCICTCICMMSRCSCCPSCPVRLPSLHMLPSLLSKLHLLSI